MRKEDIRYTKITPDGEINQKSIISTGIIDYFNSAIRNGLIKKNNQASDKEIQQKSIFGIHLRNKMVPKKVGEDTEVVWYEAGGKEDRSKVMLIFNERKINNGLTYDAFIAETVDNNILLSREVVSTHKTKGLDRDGFHCSSDKNKIYYIDFGVGYEKKPLMINASNCKEAFLKLLSL